MTTTPDNQLLASIRAALPELTELKKRVNQLGVDPIYRFYHQSFKVFYLQDLTKQIVAALSALRAGEPLNAWFLKIVHEGTSGCFSLESTNKHWLEETRPILEAFFHAKFFLEQVVRYGNELTEAPRLLPSGWAAVLYLYNLR